jgi:hypothetical protein
MLALGPKAFEVVNVENNKVEGLYMAIKYIAFFIFVLNVAIINSAPKMVNVSCDDNVVNCVISCIYTYA